MKATEAPHRAHPAITRASSSGKSNILEGPKMNKEIELMIKANYVIYIAFHSRQNNPTKGDEIAYTKQATPNTYPILSSLKPNFDSLTERILSKNSKIIIATTDEAIATRTLLLVKKMR